MAEARVALAGMAHQDLPPGAQPLGPVDPAEPIEVSVLVRPRRPLDELEQRLEQGAPPLSREAFAERYGADPAAVEAVERFAAAHGLRMVQADAARRTIVLGGTAAQLSEAFGVALQRFQAPDGSVFRAHSGALSVAPADAALSRQVEAVLGLDTRPQARPR
jgi:kumamolisin